MQFPKKRAAAAPMRRLQLIGGSIVLSIALHARQSAIAAGDDLAVDKLAVVDCMLPGQKRLLGGKAMYVGPRRPKRLSAEECGKVGGEYVAYDRADYATAFKIWLAQAQQNDPEAQVYVGEMYEKGQGVANDYAQAATWYEKAAKQDYTQGLIHSAYLYEQGLGVPRDSAKALNLYRKAAGIKGDDLTYSSEVAAARAEVDRLSIDLAERDQSAEALATMLADTRKQLAAEQEIADKLRGEKSKLYERIKRLEALPPSASNNQELEHLKSEITDRDNKLAAQATQISTLEKSSSSQETDLSTKLGDSRQEADSLRQQLGTARAQLERDREQLEAQTALANALDLQLKSLEAKRESDERTLTTVQAQLKEARGAQDVSRSDALNATVTQQQGELSRQKAVIATLQSQRQDLESALSAAKIKHEEDSRSVKTSEETVTDLRIQLASSQSSILRKTAEEKDLESQLEAAAAEISRVKQTLNASATNATAKDAEIARMSAALTDREAKLASLQAQIAGLRSTIDSEKHTERDVQRKLAPVNDVSALALGVNRALIIGNEIYGANPEKNLKTASKDARDVERELSDRYGYKGHTVVLLNATKQQMLDALYKVSTESGDRDSLMIYYAGHGSLEQSSRESYWLPVDYDDRDSKTWISEREITGWVGQSKALHVLIVADSCYAGAMIHGATAQLTSNGSPQAEKLRLVLLAKLASRTVMTSGGLEPVNDGGPDGNSIFAHEFIRALKLNTQIIEATTLYFSLADQVKMAAKRLGLMSKVRGMVNPMTPMMNAEPQTPEIAWLADAGHKPGGEFLFMPTAEADAAVARADSTLLGARFPRLPSVDDRAGAE